MIIITDDGAVHAVNTCMPERREQSRVWRCRHFLSLCSETSVTVRHESHTVSMGFLRANAGEPDTTREVRCFMGTTTLSPAKPTPECGWVSVPYSVKIILPGTRFVCVAGILPHWNRSLPIQLRFTIHRAYVESNRLYEQLLSTSTNPNCLM